MRCSLIVLYASFTMAFAAGFITCAILSAGKED
jgi:hypothetical protein